MPRKRLENKTCPNCLAVFKPRNAVIVYCGKECYREARKSGKYEKVLWTEDMRKKMSEQYKGAGNPMCGKTPWNTGRKRPEIQGEKHWNYKGGWLQSGYKYVCINGEQLAEHRYLMEQHFGRKLEEDEIVHHINGNRTDNRIENLEVVTRAEHIEIHRKDLRK